MTIEHNTTSTQELGDLPELSVEEGKLVNAMKHLIQEYARGNRPEVSGHLEIVLENALHIFHTSQGLPFHDAWRQGGRQEPHLAEVFYDVAERSLASSETRFDSLTGALSRAQFFDDIGHRLNTFKENSPETEFSVLYVDMNNLKKINDKYENHSVGDLALKALYATLFKSTRVIRGGDDIYRLGGDEFVVMVATDIHGAQVVAKKIIDNLAEFNARQRMLEPGFEVHVSIGVASVSQIISDTQSGWEQQDRARFGGTLLDAADKAMYEAKKEKYDSQGNLQSRFVVHE